MTFDDRIFSPTPSHLLASTLFLLAFALVSTGCDVGLDVDDNVYACSTSDDCRQGYECVSVPDKTRRECRIAGSTDTSDATDADEADVTDARDTTDDTVDTALDTSTDTTDAQDADADECTEGAVCYSGRMATRGEGLCEDGTIVCSADGSTECDGQVLPSGELCTGGEDEDCDGDIDCGDSDCTEECRLRNAAHWFFTTKFKHNGDFGGIDDAHRFCSQQANGAGLQRGNWDAVLANLQVGPESFIEVRGDVVQMDGTLFANQDNFWTSPFENADIDEHGDQIAGSNIGRAWTGVDPQGGWAQEQCVDSTPTTAWNSAQTNVLGMTGSLSGQDSRAWLGDRAETCDQQWHVYCISNQD